MKIKRSSNAKKGILSGVINKIVNILLPFILQTVLIRSLGVQYVGIKGLFTSILSILSLAELGVGTAIVYSMYKPIADDDLELICAYLSLYRKLYRMIGGLIFVFGLVTMPFIPYLIEGDYPIEINLYIVYFLYLLDTVLSYFLFAYKSSLLTAYQRTDVMSNIGTLTSTLLCICQIVVLIISGNFYLYLALSVLFTVLRNIIISISVGRMFPEICARGKLNNEQKKSIKVKFGGLIIAKICNATRNTFDNIFMTAFLGLTLSAMYSNYYYVIAALTGFMVIILASLRGGIGNSLETETIEKNYRDFIKMNFIYMMISGWMSVCMLCLYQPFMTIWIGDKYLFPTYVMIQFPLYFYILKMGDIGGVYSESAGLFWENRYRTLAEAILNIVLNFVFVKLWGAFGVMLATNLTLFFIGFICASHITFKYLFKTGEKKYVINQIRYLMVTIVIAIFVYLICSLLPFDNYIIQFVFRAAICLIVTPICYFILLGKTNEYQDSKRWIIDIIRVSVKNKKL